MNIFSWSENEISPDCICSHLLTSQSFNCTNKQLCVPIFKTIGKFKERYDSGVVRVILVYPK